MKPLLIALKGERDAHNFYARMARRSTNPTGRKMFTFLAKEEKRHIKLIEGRLKKLKVSLDTSGVTERISTLSEGMFADKSASDIEIVEIALEQEKQAHEFYVKAAANSTVPEDSALYALLANDEKGHIHLLEKEALRLKRA